MEIYDANLQALSGYLQQTLSPYNYICEKEIETEQPSMSDIKISTRYKAN